MLFLGDWAPGAFEVNVNIENEFVILNLEGPVLENTPTRDLLEKAAQKKAGPILWNKSFPKSKNRYAFALANNHFNDLGKECAEQSISKITYSGYDHLGYGLDVYEARKPLEIDYEGQELALFSMTEKQFGFATNTEPGVCVEGHWIYSALSQYQTGREFVILIIHGGLEMSPFPTPETRERYKSYIDAGADLIVAHHPHVPQFSEWYKGKLITYGLGNFAIDPTKWKGIPAAKWSIGIDLKFDEGLPVITQRYFQISESSPNTIDIHEIQADENTSFLRYREIIEQIKDAPELYEEVWKHKVDELWKEYIRKYLFSLRSWEFGDLIFLLAKIIRKRGFSEGVEMLRTQKSLLSAHVLSVDTHKELAVTYLNQNSNQHGIMCTEARAIEEKLKVYGV